MITAAPPVRGLRELRGLYGDLHTFGLDLRDAAQRFQSMVSAGAFPENGAAFRYRRADQGHLLNRSIDITRSFEFLVAVTGAFSSGKSSILNLLLERPDLLPASVIPLTAVCTVLRYGERPRLCVRFVSVEQALARIPAYLGQPLRRPLPGPERLADLCGELVDEPDIYSDDEGAQASLRAFGTLLPRLGEVAAEEPAFAARAPWIAGGGVRPDDGAPGGVRYYRPTPREQREYLAAGGDPARWVTREWLALVRDVTLWVDSPLLANDVVLLDLPGLNCREDYHRRAIQEYCNRADCIVVTAFQPGNQSDQEVLSNFKNLSANYREKIFFVFNKVDQFASEPQELVRAVDYLARDTIGADFPRERFFLTSAQLAREARSAASAETCAALGAALAPAAAEMPGFGPWLDRVAGADDPGGVRHLRERLQGFLVTGAYPTKIAELVGNFGGVLDALVGAAQPSFDECAGLAAEDILRSAVLEFFRHTEGLQRNAICRFRYDYLRGHEAGGGRVLREDLKVLLERVHEGVKETIRAHFDRPILTAPLRDDPVSSFDLQRIADEASEQLRREFQELVTGGVLERVREVFRGILDECGFTAHAANLFAGTPEVQRRLDGILQEFDRTVEHSLKCIVRNGFYSMPRGRDLKRLERSIPLARLKELLVDVFCDFYPSWIYENISSEVIDGLWLSLFLDCEDLEFAVRALFRDAEGAITGAQAAERVVVPRELGTGSRELYQRVQMCRRLAELRERREELARRAELLGGAVR